MPCAQRRSLSMWRHEDAAVADAADAGAGAGAGAGPSASSGGDRPAASVPAGAEVWHDAGEYVNAPFGLVSPRSHLMSLPSAPSAAASHRRPPACAAGPGLLVSWLLFRAALQIVIQGAGCVCIEVWHDAGEYVSAPFGLLSGD